MPEVPSGSIISVQNDARLFSQQVLLTLHYRIETVFGGDWDLYPTLSALDGIFNSAGGLWETYAAAQSNNVTYSGLIYQMIWETRYLKTTISPATTTGSVASPCETPNIAAGITLQGELTGRTNRGTKHIGGLPTSFVSAGTLTAGALTAMNDLRDKMIETIDINGDASVLAVPVVYHRAAPISSVVIVAGVAHSQVRTMRRRTVGLGS